MRKIKTEMLGFHKKTGLAQAVCMAGSILISVQALAQEDTVVLEELIVTGTAGGVGISKMDASFSVTSIDDEDILAAAPHSSADILKEIPGVWVEASGGVAGANIDVRGLPGGSDAPFVSYHINGMPIYIPPTLSFLENSSIFRLDDTIANVQALRGGPNPVFSNGQAGLTVNSTLKEGGDETEGSVRYSLSDYDLQRIDAVVSGALSDNVYYMVGGYLSSSPGIRDAGFTSEKGSQFTANLTWELENGKANLFHRQTDDHGTWYLPGPATQSNDVTFVGPLNRSALVPVTSPDGAGGADIDFQPFNMAEGRGWDGSVSGFSYEVDFAEGWSLIERASLTRGDADTLGFVPNGGPVSISSLGVSGASTVSGSALADDSLVIQQGPWVVRKEIESFTNDLTIAKTWDEGKLSLGIFSSEWSVDEFWSLGNQKYYTYTNGANGELVDDTIACNAADVQTCGWSYDVDALGDAREQALYLAVQQNFGDITLDFGARSANRETQYSVDDGVIDGDYRTFDTDENGTAFTLGVDWRLSETMGVFARVNSGFKFADFDTYRDFTNDFNAGSDLIIDIDQYELGFKMSTESSELFVTLFGAETEGQPSCTIGGGECFRAETESVGLEIDGSILVGDAFSIKINSTIQDPKFSNGANDGNRIQRQPEFQARLQPTMDLELSGGYDLALYGTIAYVDDRFSDAGNTQPLDAYTAVDLGATLSMENLNVSLNIDNAFDERGATEGDPRNLTSTSVRYIMPRNIKLSVGYSF